MLKNIKIQLDTVKKYTEIADIAFLALRVVVLTGGIAWVLFTPVDTSEVRRLLGYFVIYSLFIYLLLFFIPQKKRRIYLLSLLFDLSFMSMLVRVTGGFESHFFSGFYLMTALYSFYYGTAYGVGVAAISTVLYSISGEFDFSRLHWTDFSIKVSFLFLIALPLGMLSQKLKKDRNRMEQLNTELQRHIEELTYIQGKLIQAEKLSALGRLTADVAHEIRNPLTAIGGFARRLDKKLPPESREKEYASLIVSEVERLEKILRDILTFSREAKLHMEYQDINQAVNDSILTFVDVYAEQSIQVKKELAPSLPQVLIDKDQVIQAINNLISNAVAAMPSGGILTVRTFKDRMYEVDYVVVEVSDTGVGIPEDKLNMIFEPFFSTKEIGAGTGLGLSICKKIIDEHGGLIRVVTEEGKGTSFRLFFPYQDRQEEGRMKCWEFHKCGVEKIEDSALRRCPAYPNFGRICWVIAGTFCERKVEGAIARKLGDCKRCEFYQRVVVRKDL